MPIYAYRCAGCGHATDMLRKYSDPPLTSCPSCGAEALEKQVTAAGFQLKGSGWYVTDFKGDSRAARPAADGAAEAAKADGASGEAGKPEGAKTDAKADAAKTDAGKTDAGKRESGQSESGKGDTARNDGAGTKGGAAATLPSAPAAGAGTPAAGQ